MSINSTLHKSTYILFLKLLFIYSLCAILYTSIQFKYMGIHISFLSTYLFSRSILEIVNNYIILLWIFIFFNYALFFKNEWTYGIGGKRPSFSSLTAPGLNIIVVSVVVVLIAVEFITPSLSYQLNKIKAQTELSNVLLNIAEEYFKEKEYEKSLEAYQKFQLLIKADKFVKERVRKLELNIVSANVKKEKIIESVPDTINNYMEYADYYYQSGDYISAWYYYQYVGDTTFVERKKALSQIENIKKILTYRKSLLNDDEKKAFIDEQNFLIRDIYNKMQVAYSLYENKDYLKAYYKYNEIIIQYPSIRDAKILREKCLIFLENNYVNLEKANDATFFPAKENLIFYYNDTILLKAQKVIKNINPQSLTIDYFFYNIYIYKMNSKTISVDEIIFSSYAQYTNKSLSLIAFDTTNKLQIYYPVYYKMHFEIFNKLSSMLNENDAKIFQSKYRKDGEYFYLNDTKNETVREVGVLFDVSALNGEIIKNGVLPFNFDMNLIYTMKTGDQTPESLSIINLLHLKNNYSLNFKNIKGISQNFIRIGITERVSQIFLFLTSSIILLALCFRNRAKTFKSLYYLFTPFVIILFYAVYHLLIYCNRLLITSFANVLSTTELVIFSVAFYMILLIFAVIYNSSTKV